MFTNNYKAFLTGKTAWSSGITVTGAFKDVNGTTYNQGHTYYTSSSDSATPWECLNAITNFRAVKYANGGIGTAANYPVQARCCYFSEDIAETDYQLQTAVGTTSVLNDLTTTNGYYLVNVTNTGASDITINGVQIYATLYNQSASLPFKILIIEEKFEDIVIPPSGTKTWKITPKFEEVST